VRGCSRGVDLPLCGHSGTHRRKRALVMHLGAPARANGGDAADPRRGYVADVTCFKVGPVLRTRVIHRGVSRSQMPVQSTSRSTRIVDVAERLKVNDDTVRRPVHRTNRAVPVRWGNLFVFREKASVCIGRNAPDSRERVPARRHALTRVPVDVGVNDERGGTNPTSGS